MGYVCYLHSSGAPWHYMLSNPTTIGIILENSLCVFSCFPVPIVLILLILTAYRARTYLDTIINVNQIINLSGILEVVPYWQKNANFCVYSMCFQELCNVIMNFSNSVIVARTRHVRVTLRNLYQSTCSVVDNFTRSGDRTREPLIGKGSTSTSRVY